MGPYTIVPYPIWDPYSMADPSPWDPTQMISLLGVSKWRSGLPPRPSNPGVNSVVESHERRSGWPLRH